jgi:gas vesicle structural protein
MSVATRGTASNYLQRAPSPSSLADVVDLILDKGLVIDAYVRVAVIGIELITIDARIVIASVDTYLRFAEAVNRLDLSDEKAGLPDLVEGGAKKAAEAKVQGAIEAPKEKAAEAAQAGKDKAASGFERVKEKIPGR